MTELRPPGVSGSLLSLQYATRELAEARFSDAAGDHAWTRSWWDRCAGSLGPASPVRTILDTCAIPLFERLGFQLAGAPSSVGDGWLACALEGDAVDPVPLVIGPWSEPMARLRAGTLRLGAVPHTRWCFGCTGRYVSLIDTRRAFARAFLEFDLDVALDDRGSTTLLLALLGRRMLAADSAGESELDRLIAGSNAHRVDVCEALHRGVRAALTDLSAALPDAARRRKTGRPRPRDPRDPDERAAVLEQALAIVYRVLFLLFAEARGLVPDWHPTYRDGYTIEALRRELDATGRPIPGVWEALDAIGRLLDRGCSTPDLRVAGFDGRLFAPEAGPAGDPARRDDAAATRALRALTTSSVPGDHTRRPIAFDELGVEELGAVYERVLDLDVSPEAGDDPAVRRTTRRRRSTGSYYTPRAITDYLVRTAIEPLVREASSDDILALRVVDPAMGSGAFLVGACRYLAWAYERALVREGRLHDADVTDADRASFRRVVAQRCLYGVDRNPMAVQLARLSVWLTTLAADRPLTFLDHHLRAGDSLVGAAPEDLARRPPCGGRRVRRGDADLPLFDDRDLAASVDDARRRRMRIAEEPPATVAAARAKRRLLDRLDGADSPVGRWRTALDVWCAGWFWPSRPLPTRQVLADLIEAALGGRATLPTTSRDRWLADVRSVARSHAFFHWSLEFPEVFHDERGRIRHDRGFDAVIGNPPWSMIRGDARHCEDVEATRAHNQRLIRFCRESGVYATRTTGQPNAYQLFLDRCLSLLRRGGRLAMVLPAGVLTDHGSAALRRRLLNDAAVQRIVGFENRDAVFPIHRGVRFVLVTATTGRPTDRISCRFRMRDPRMLDETPDTLARAPSARLPAAPEPVELTRALIERLSTEEQLVVPELPTSEDVRIVDGVYRRCPALGAAGGGWGARFGRELNRTQDRRWFRDEGPGVPVLDGKHVAPFTVDVSASRWRIPDGVARRLLGPRWPARTRLAYRDVASASNRLTLIAAIVPAEAVTTHTLFCLRTRLRPRDQWFLCGALNSYVANYLVRTRVGTHVTVAITESLPVPRPPDGSAWLRRIAALARTLSRQPSARAAAAELQARMALLYGLDGRGFERVLETFPLVDVADREAALDAFGRIGA